MQGISTLFHKTLASLLVILLRFCLHDTGSPTYRILFISDWGCVYTALHESDTLCSNNPVQLYSVSAGGTKMNPIQSVPFCFTYKHRNPIGNARKPRFDNRMASTQIKLIDCLANMVDVMKLFWHEIVSLGCFPGFV